MVVAVFSHPLSPIQQRVIVVFTGDTPEPSSSMFGVDQGHVGTTARAKTGGDPEIHMLGEVEFSPCRLEVFNRNGHVVFVDTSATTSIADVHGCLHVVLPPVQWWFHASGRTYLSSSIGTQTLVRSSFWSSTRYGLPWSQHFRIRPLVKSPTLA